MAGPVSAATPAPDSPPSSASSWPSPTSQSASWLPNGPRQTGLDGSTHGASPSTSSLGGLVDDAWRACAAWRRFLTAWLARLSLAQRIAAVAGSLVLCALAIAMLVYSQRFLDWLGGPVTQSWRDSPILGPLLIFSLVFVTAFPPLFGYSTATTVAGFVYGFPGGWPLAAAACVTGSLGAFLACRTVLGRRVQRLVGDDARFIALGQVLRHEGLLYLIGIRFCPLPFSLSNGFLATIPSITPVAFALSTAISTPKLLVHVFIGSRLAILADQGASMSLLDKAINYSSMLLGAAVGFTIGLIIYRRTMSRAAELALESGHEIPSAQANALETSSARAAEQGAAGYRDADVPLLDPDDAAAVMSDDALSLWDADWDAGQPVRSTHDAKGDAAG
ncbi:hypothetical protein CDD81_7659 [Ophiocordyceps australis]|uniref:Golgi apparatus membrane protein TVP38 n=1 Tax=Ophiocordyceps australis TaxID=1399860 RepID=A0A2C5XXQ5_9HYPO|nr:hypothetical protein CDD81_7659 [Ophiocordyceps australis]